MAETIWENLLADMRDHVGNLQERVVQAEDALEKSQAVNEKINIMKEYKDEAGTVNSCFRSKDRAGLVRSLQHENREILSLQDENRQMKLALEDMQRGMTLIMEKHRKTVRDFERSNLILDLMKQRFDETQANNVYEQRFYELVDLVDGIFKEMSEQHSKDMERYAEVCAENKYLRQALVSRGFRVPGQPEPSTSSANQSKNSPLDTSTNSQIFVESHADETPKKVAAQAEPLLNGGVGEVMESQEASASSAPNS